jgi:hypothetical protein
MVGVRVLKDIGRVAVHANYFSDYRAARRVPGS